MSPAEIALILIAVFIVLLLIGSPIMVALGIAAMAAFYAVGTIWA